MTSASEIIAAIADLDTSDMAAILAAVASRLAHSRPAPEPSAPAAADDESLTIEEAATLLRKSTKWIYRHRERLPFIRKIGPRSYLVSKSGLLRWRDRQHG
ncbi:MAG: helix-turn-helix domain-containing protein [Deltaproteobacteria bacterium]|nr:helix-turn-helix domain-containing protein [Deltaproteobacteria bacterium]